MLDFTTNKNRLNNQFGNWEASNGKNRIYFAVVQNFEKNIVKGIKLSDEASKSNGADVARNVFSGLVGKGKEYDAGVLFDNNRQRVYREVWQVGKPRAVANLDNFEMIGRWLMEELKVWNEAPKTADEEGWGLYTKKWMNEERAKGQKKILDMYKGQGKAFFKRYYDFKVALYNEKNEQMTVAYSRGHNNMKAAVTHFVTTTWKRYFDLRLDGQITWMAFVAETQPFWCSKGKITEGACRKLLGMALFHHNLKPEDGSWENKHIPANLKESYTTAVLRLKADNKLVTVPLSNNVGAARNEFKNIAKSTQGRKKYSAGFVYSKRTGVDNRANTAWLAKEFYPTEELVFDLIGEFAQENLKLFTTADGWSEKAANVRLLHEVQKDWAKQLSELRGQWKGKNERLHRSEPLAIVRYHEKSFNIDRPW